MQDELGIHIDQERLLNDGSRLRIIFSAVGILLMGGAGVVFAVDKMNPPNKTEAVGEYEQAFSQDNLAKPKIGEIFYVKQIARQNDDEEYEPYKIVNLVQFEHDGGTQDVFAIIQRMGSDGLAVGGLNPCSLEKLFKPIK